MNIPVEIKCDRSSCVVGILSSWPVTILSKELLASAGWAYQDKQPAGGQSSLRDKVD